MTHTMKTMLAALAVCTCTVTASVSAATIHTPAGTMDTGRQVNVVSAANSQTFQIVKDLVAKQPATSAQDQVTKNEIMNALDNAKAYGDVYQLQGQNQNGNNTALLVAVNAKPILDQAMQNARAKMTAKTALPGDFGMAVVQALFTAPSGGYQIPQQLEPVLFETVNTAMKNGEANINQSWAKSSAKTGMTNTVKFEDMEYMSQLPGANYTSYTAGTRALVDLNGFQLPYYVKAYLVMNPQAPTVYVTLTSDVERGYFQPIFDAAIKPIK